MSIELKCSEKTRKERFPSGKMKVKRMYEKIYEAKTWRIKESDVQEIGEFIEHIKNRTPENILREVAKNPKSKIYRYVFNNSNAKAVHEYRLERVRWICREIIYKLNKAEHHPNIRLFYNVVNDKGRKEYKTMEEVFSNEEYSNQVIQQALFELTNWTERYRAYKKLKGLVSVIEKQVKKLGGRRKQDKKRSKKVSKKNKRRQR